MWEQLSNAWKVGKWILFAAELVLLTLVLMLARFSNPVLWNVLTILMVPAFLAAIAALFQKAQSDAEQKASQKRWEEDAKREQRRAKLEARLALDNQRQKVLENYLDRMTEILLIYEMPGEKIGTISRARTLAILPILNHERNELVLRFLHDSGLNRVTSFSEAYVTEVDVRDADFHGFDFAGAFLAGGNFSSTDLRKANLDDSDIFEVDLSDVDLREATFLNASFFVVEMNQTDLRDADLRNSDLAVVDLRGADLRGADLRWKEANDIQFDHASYDSRTKWPKGFDPKAAGAILVDEDGNPVEDSG